jgi:hypothetical protein
MSNEKKILQNRDETPDKSLLCPAIGMRFPPPPLSNDRLAARLNSQADFFDGLLAYLDL